MSGPRLLIVDDEKSLRDMLACSSTSRASRS